MQVPPKRSQERHGKRYLPEYQLWLAMKQRCHNPKNKRYPLYGGRGITVCPEWRESFEAFLRDVGRRPAERLTLDRIDNNKGYEPGNVKWTTWTEQSRNRRNCSPVEFRGKKLFLRDWAEETGIPLKVLKARIGRYGWSVERALTEPVGSPRKSSRMLTHNGKTMPMVQWARELGVNYKTLKNRINNLGWPIERALTTP